MKYLVLQKAGLYRECEPGEATAVFLGAIEYNNLKKYNFLDLDIRAYNSFIRNSREKEKIIKNEIKTTDAEIEALQDEVDAKMAAKHDLDNKVRNVHAKNENLLRMIKENSNQDRNLRPKKGHPGYRVIRQDEETITIGYDGNGNPIDLRGWRTTLETPYDIDIPVELIEETVKDDLSQALRGDIEIYKGRYMDVPETARAGNVIYDYDFHANVNDKNHLWTICLHSPYQIEIKDGKKEVEDGKEDE